VTEIQNSAFKRCINLPSVTIPDSVTEIWGYAFGYCHSLKDVTISRDTPLRIYKDVFQDVPLSQVTLRVPRGTEDLYRAAPVWGDFDQITSAPQ
jgi:hypothetical protein